MQILTLSNISNELILFKVAPAKKECSVESRLVLPSAPGSQSMYDKLHVFGPLIMARNTVDASLHMYMTSSDDLNAFLNDY